MTMKEIPDGESTCDPLTQEMLLEALLPIEPQAERRASMRERIFERIHSQPVPQRDLITVRADEGNWIEVAPGVRLKKLLHSGGVVASLIRMRPGSSIPAHEHPEPEECICLEGEVWLGSTRVCTGDFHYAPAGVPHGVVHSPAGCLLYVRTSDPG